MVKVKFKKIFPDSKAPYKKNPHDAGFDLFAHSIKTETPKYIEYGTGISLEIPKGYFGIIFPRSSITERDLFLKNSCGIIDSGYRGEILFRFYKLGDYVYEIGERLGQIIIFKSNVVLFEETQELDKDLDRGGGYGSTGK